MLSNALSMMQQNPQMMQQMMSQMGGTGSPGGMPGMDMNAMGQMLGGMNFNNQATTTQQPHKQIPIILHLQQILMQKRK